MLNTLVYRLLENSLIMSAAIVLLYILSRLLRSKTSPRLRFVCWLVIAVGLLLPVRPTFYTVTLPDSVTANLPVAEVFGQPADPQLPTGDVFVESPDIQPDTSPATVDNAAILSSHTDLVSAQPADAPVVPVATSLLSRLWNNAPFLLWASGAFVFLMLCAIRHRRFAKNVRQWSRLTSDEGLIALLNEVCGDANLRRRPKLFICPLVTTPVTMGLFRPVLILPDEPIEPEQLRLMLLHEVTHCKHGDIWAKALSLLAMSAHWFNPLVWLMNRYLITEAELACDAAVLRHAGNGQRIAYGETILHAARRGQEVSTLLASAFSGGGKNLKRRLAAIVENKVTRRWVAVGCAVILLGGLLLVWLGGFGGGGAGGIVDPIQDAPVNLTPTDNLVIYVPAWSKYSDDLEYAVKLYKEKYRDVNVTVETIGDENDETGQQYADRVRVELMAGTGPDVILASPDIFPNLYGTMDTGAFLNLSSIIADDGDFNMDDYIQPVIDAGLYKEGRYLIPYSYQYSSIVAYSDSMSKVGFDMTKNTNFTSFFDELDGCLPKLQENPSFLGAFYDSDDYFKTAVFDSGLTLVDFERQSVLPDEAGLKAFCEAFKPYWDIDQSSHPWGGFFDHFSDESSLFDRYDSMYYTLIWGAALANGDAIQRDNEVSAIYGMDGGLHARVGSALAIRSGSPNQYNAWNFIKIMMSEKEQEGQYRNGPKSGSPVNRSALTVVQNTGGMEVFGWIDSNTGTEYTKRPFTEEEMQPIRDLDVSVTNCVIPNYDTVEILRECMTPWFNDEKSYDECVTALRQKLTFYVSE